jgi:predicted Zn-dependent protease
MLRNARTALERLAARDYPAAIAAFEAVLAAEPANAAAAFLLGWTYHGAGDDRLAIGAWRRAAYLRPDFIPAHLALAEIFVSLSQPALARQALQSGLAAAPESPELRDRLARLDRP